MEPVEPFFTAAFGKEIAKTFIISAASSVATIGAFIAVGIVISEVQKRRKKSQQTVTAV